MIIPTRPLLSRNQRANANPSSPGKWMSSITNVGNSRSTSRRKPIPSPIPVTLEVLPCEIVNEQLALRRLILNHHDMGLLIHDPLKLSRTRAPVDCGRRECQVRQITLTWPRCQVALVAAITAKATTHREICGSFARDTNNTKSLGLDTAAHTEILYPLLCFLVRALFMASSLHVPIHRIPYPKQSTA